MSETLDYLKMFAQFSISLRRYLRHHLTLDQARCIVRERMQRREENFLRIVERSVYGYPRSPYRALLKLAGCELSDVHALVKQKGLEGALLALREAGVYIAFEEFKGRATLVRSGQEIPVTARDFDNRFSSRHFYTETGGSTGKATRVSHDLDHTAALAPHNFLVRAAHRALDAPLVIWRGILPDGSGMNHVLYPAYYDKYPAKWNSQLAPFSTRSPLKFTLATYYFVLLARLYGAPIPFPHYLPSERGEVVARTAAALVQQYGKCLIATTVSRGLRVALAAQEAGIDLSGVTFMIAGEPLTLAKARGILQSGARFFPTYGLAEVGRIGMGCVNPCDETDVHLLKDAFALIPYEHPVEGFEVSVPAFHITTLLPTTPKLMLNVEVDDYGLVEERECGCELGALGYTTHLRGMRSYRKLTGEGATLVGTVMIHILEEVLPERYGGSPLDYQLLEREDESGLTKYDLIVSPRVEINDEGAVIDTVLHALRASSVAGSAAQTIWHDARTFQVKRMEPIWTARGKFNPLYVQRHLSTESA